MERIFRTASVAGWIRKRGYDLLKLNYRAWPTMRENQGSGLFVWVSLMNEMNISIVNCCNELVETI